MVFSMIDSLFDKGTMKKFDDLAKKQAKLEEKKKNIAKNSMKKMNSETVINVIKVVKEYGEYEIIGRTHDDAAGEAFDKVARAIGLGYPGGPKIDALAKEGNENAIPFKKVRFADESLDFSFSGIKTGVINYCHTLEQNGEEVNKADVAASFQKSVCEVMVDNLIDSAVQYSCDTVVLAGGVACNTALRAELDKRKGGLKVFYPSPVYCTDNAAMIGCCAFYELQNSNIADLSLNAIPYLGIDLN